MRKTITFMVMALFCLFFKVQGQTKYTLTGSVIDSESNKPLKGATIKFKGRNLSTSTDEKGYFNLTLNDRKGSITISFTGYDVKDIPFYIAQNEPLMIRLTANKTVLGEVSIVSTGYQDFSQERATGSFAKIDKQLLDRRVSADVLSKLEGVVPGLLFNRNKGNSANGVADISIRGHSTLFSNDQPLVVVDGFPYQGDINYINPNDIESITVLKDAAAASIWGVRSGNGVIVMTTKKGHQNQPVAVEFNANVTVGKKPDVFYSPNFINSDTYINIEQLLFSKGYYDASLSDPNKVISPAVQILANQRAGTITGDAATATLNMLRAIDDRNAISKYFYQPSVQQQYNLNFHGGGVKSDYFFSFGEDHGQSNSVGNSTNRITINADYNFYPTDNLKISVRTNTIKSDNTNNSQIGNIAPGGSYQGSGFPYTQFTDASGNALPIMKLFNQSLTNNAQQQGFLNWQFIPLDEQKAADNTTASLDNRVNLGLEYKIIKGLKADFKYQYEKANSLQSNFYSTSTFFARNLINEYSQKSSSGAITYPIPVGGILQSSENYLNSQQLRAQFNYNTTIQNLHDINIIAGAEVNSTVNSGNSMVAYGYNKDTETNTSQIDFVDYFNLNPAGSSAQIPNNQSFFKTTDHFISYFTNAFYTYDQKYTLSLSGRIDKSNLFGVSTNQKAVPLFSTGAAWDLSKEKFYHLNFLPFLKLRVTYGYNANLNRTATAVTTLQQFSGSYFTGVPYNTIASPGNQDLRWEKDRMINVGFDYSAKRNFLSGSFDYFFKRSTDLFGVSNLAPSTGIPYFFGNAASTKGQGFDFVINSVNFKKANLSWTTNLLISHVLDKVIGYDLQSDVQTFLNSSSGNGGVITPLVGQPIFGVYSVRNGPLTHNTGDPQGYLNGQLSTDYANIVANTKLSDLIYNGPSRPTTFGSFRNNITYRKWAFSVNVIYKFDYYFRRSSTSINYSSVIFGGGFTDYANRWQKPGDENITSVPSIQMPPSDGNRDFLYRFSQNLVEKADNIRLQDIRLSYTLKNGIFEKSIFKNMQVYGYINNVGILWRANKDHLDPDIYAGSLPLPLTISFGMNTNF